MRKKKYKRVVEANNYFCIHCAMENEEFVDAEHVLWDDIAQKAIPVCNHHLRVLEEVENFFCVFSRN